MGADFRSLLPKIFEHRLQCIMRAHWTQASMEFSEEIMTNPRAVPILVKSAVLQLKSSPEESHSNNKSHSKNADSAPPVILLDFPLLAEFCNSLLVSFNELRLWAPLSLRTILADDLHTCLMSAVQASTSCYRLACSGALESGSDTKVEMDNLAKELKCMAEQLAVTFFP